MLKNLHHIVLAFLVGMVGRLSGTTVKLLKRRLLIAVQDDEFGRNNLHFLQSQSLDASAGESRHNVIFSAFLSLLDHIGHNCNHNRIVNCFKFIKSVTTCDSFLDLCYLRSSSERKE